MAMAPLQPGWLLPRRLLGYFSSSPVIPVVQVQRLAGAVSELEEQGISPTFLAMYDEFWHFLNGFNRTFEPILGKGFRFRPDFWIWHVEQGPEHRGWKPHRDAPFLDRLGPDSFVRSDGMPRMCTIWIALTDARVLLCIDQDDSGARELAEAAALLET